MGRTRAGPAAALCALVVAVAYGGCRDPDPREPGGSCRPPTSLPPAAAAAPIPYGPKGYTRTPEVVAVLAPYEAPDETGGTVAFDIPASAARRLLEVLPAAQAGDAQNASPTFEQFLSMASRCPSVTFQGYRVTPDRDDERITIVSLAVPVGDMTEEMRDFVAALGPDEMWETAPGNPPFWVAWWD